MSLPESLTLGDFADVLPNPVVIVDQSGDVLYGNAKSNSLLPPARSGTPINIKAAFLEPAGDVDRFLKMCGRNLQPVPGKFTLRSDDGSGDTYHMRGARIRKSDMDAIWLEFHDKSRAGGSKRFRILNETIDKLQLEIKSRKQVEAVLEAEKQTLASVISGQPLSTAMKLLAVALEEQQEGMLASILMLDEDKRLRHMAGPSLPADYSNAIDGLEIGRDVGSCGHAAYTGLTTIVTDVMEDPKWAPYRELIKAANLRACWSTPIFASDGEVRGTLAMYYRVPRAPTDEELNLIANSAYVAGIVVERYRSQEALAESFEREKALREAAERENDAKDDFLAMLGHELRNPISAVANAAFALEARAGSDDTVNKLYRIVVNETTLLKRILDDLLDLSRLSRGKLQLHRAPLQLEKFVDGLQIAMCSAYPQRQIDFEVHGEPGTIVADASRLRQSVQNLVDNAIKYSSAGDQVRFRLDAGKDTITIEVSDTGEGISPDILPTIFEPFVQADRSLDRPTSGLGLGLALAKQFTEMHAGQIEVSSEGAGRGSSFKLVIPRGSETDLPAVAEPTPVNAGDRVGERKVLVVEDNSSAREGLCQLLEIWGHVVFAAADGEQALKVLRDARPDVALVDIGLPRIDGYEVAATVRKDPANKDIKLVALTGYGQDSDRQRALDAGFDAHIVKPADITDLIAILGEPKATALASRA